MKEAEFKAEIKRAMAILAKAKADILTRETEKNLREKEIKIKE